MQQTTAPVDKTSALTSRSTILISRILMALALICLAFLALYIPHDRPGYKRLLADFRVEIPYSTQIMFAIPDAAFPVAALVIALVVMLLQRVGRGSLVSACAHMLIILFCCAIFVTYRETLFQPVAELVRAISGPGTGG
jgi:cytochrome bd-type quinol oxidase subunit 2